MTGAVHVLVAALLIAAASLCVRFIFRRSRAIGLIVIVTIAIRLVLGLALFLISVNHLPIAQSLQVDGGFWSVALDATGYFQLAARAVQSGHLYPLDHVIPSPFFVNVLAVWMAAVGVSPVAGMFLNIALYLGLVTLVVVSFAPMNDIGRDLPCVVGVLAYSFSPLMLFDATQPLKDELSSFLLGLGLVGVLATQPLTEGVRGRRDWLFIALGALALFVAIYGSSGIRWYFGFILWVTLVMTLLVRSGVVAVRHRPARKGLIARAAAAFAIVLATFFAFRVGSGPLFYDKVIGANLDRLVATQGVGGSVLQRVAAIPADLINMAQVARTGFLMSGGGTNVIVPLRQDGSVGLKREEQLEERQHETAAYQKQLAEDASVEKPALPAPPTAAPSPRPEQVEAARGIPVTKLDEIKTVLSGLAVMFVPVAVLRPLTGLTLPGGRGLLVFADADTLFLDLMTAIVCVALWKRRRLIGERQAMVVFGVTLSILTIVLLAYVVTNLGTLWRMRLLAIIPLWLIVIAVSPRRPVTSSVASDDARAAT